ncbi:death ligand signal enhancer isoform X2 [Hypomesus transpacificus]|uniref:death ligand signal enhancer isoform X2 n=1 Tax=Hypomesus transpacificus TaxID=137520 RepID=UPI001F086AC4|nr:death ligand signal enhancer isoform X2 [Hypomesus transpacificus]
MWRVQWFVGRILSRNAPLRLSQNHHVEDEVINTSTLLSTSRHNSDPSSQKGEDGEKQKKRKTSQFCSAGLPRYTALDAVGFGAAAVLVLQICRRIHSQFSSRAEPGHGHAPGPGPAPALSQPVTATLQKCGYRVLLEILSRRDVLPRPRSVRCLWGAPDTQIQTQAQTQTQGSSNEASSSSLDHNLDLDHLTSHSSSTHQQLSQESSASEESSLSESSLSEHQPGDRKQPEQEDDQDFLSSEEKVAVAALDFRQVADSSVPVVLNIIGLESAKSSDYEAAFTCFLAAARHGYSKAQFNTGVCYERGRGVGKDKGQALNFYSQAAAGGHSQAQYRYARLLLSCRGQQSAEDLDKAIHLLEQAAVAGLTQAQVYLGSLFSQEPVRDGCMSVHYLRMAAERGDSDALLFLGQCYETGFGVQKCPRTAMKFYRQAAWAGNRPAQRLLVPPGGAEEEVLRSIQSAPSFPVAGVLLQPLSTLASPPCPSASPTLPLTLPHSWSTGSMAPLPRLSSLPLHLHPLPPGMEGSPCRWTIGV